MKINAENADIVQVVNVPVGEDIQLVAEGGGEAVVQVVHRFNRPEAEIQPVEIFTLDVDYSPDRVMVDGVISVSATVDFVPPADLDVGMVVLDIGIPTGFSPVIETVETLVNDNAKIWRYDIAERKVVLYHRRPGCQRDHRCPIRHQSPASDHHSAGHFPGVLIL